MAFQLLSSILNTYHKNIYFMQCHIFTFVAYMVTIHDSQFYQTSIILALNFTLCEHKNVTISQYTCYIDLILF